MKRWASLVISVVAVLVVGAAIAPAGAQPAAPAGQPVSCPPLPPYGVGVAAAPASAVVVNTRQFNRGDLTDAAVTLVTQAVQKAGMTPVAIAGSQTSTAPAAFGPAQAAAGVPAACVPMLTVNMTTEYPQGSYLLYVTRWTEQVTVTTILTAPDGRVWRGSQAQSASWMSGSIPLPIQSPVPGYWLPNVPIQSPQGGAERGAVETVVKALLPHVLATLRSLGMAPDAPASSVGTP